MDSFFNDGLSVIPEVRESIYNSKMPEESKTMYKEDESGTTKCTNNEEETEKADKTEEESKEVKFINDWTPIEDLDKTEIKLYVKDFNIIKDFLIK